MTAKDWFLIGVGIGRHLEREGVEKMFTKIMGPGELVETKDGFGRVLGFQVFRGKLEYEILVGAESKSRWFKAERVKIAKRRDAITRRSCDSRKS